MNQIIPAIEWPPPYKIKKHRRARYVKIRAANVHGLEITVPYRFNLRELPDILEKNKIWIIKQLANIPLPQPDVLPEKIHLHATNESWRITYMVCDARLELFQRPDNELVLAGQLTNKKLCKEMLMTWLRQRAKIYLTEQLNYFSNLTTLSYEKLTIRDQQTVWGSCTIDKTINLNYKLIFLPFHLMSYVLIHELCHTVHLNHSDRFWNLVECYDPAWKINRRELKRANQFIPSWLHMQ